MSRVNNAPVLGYRATDLKEPITMMNILAWDSPGPAPCACDGLMFMRHRAREGPDTTPPEDEQPAQDDLLVLPARVRMLLALVSVVAVIAGIVIRLLS